MATLQSGPPPPITSVHIFWLHLTTHCFTPEFCVLYSISLYNVAVLCYIACHCVEEKQSCLFPPCLSRSLSLSPSCLWSFFLLSLRLSALPLGSPFSSLCCSTILSLLSGPGMQLTYGLSLSAGLALLMDAGLCLTHRFARPSHGAQIPGEAH